MHLLRDLWISITICAAIVTGLSLYSGALAETVSQIVSDAEKAEKAGAYDRAIDLYSNALASENKTYFLGTIVLTQSDNKWEVADGQQRLATTAILMKARID